jgi:predicted amidophosphoribosyltransferase
VTRINPRLLEGPWHKGYALDVHSTGSEFLGYDEYGREQFDTKRTDVGELLYRVKYRGDEAALADLADVMAAFVRSKELSSEIIVPVPPTRVRRVQPLSKIVVALGQRLRIPVIGTAVKKSGGAELKNLHAFGERRKVLENAISVDPGQVVGKRILLVDDLVRSGATIAAVAEQLAAAGAGVVHVLVATQTRRR